MHITHIVASLEYEAAGTSYSVRRLAEAAAARPGNEVEIFSLGAPTQIVSNGVQHTLFSNNLSWAGPLARLGVSAEMNIALSKSKSDVLHTHGFWMMPTVYPANAAKASGARLIHSPHGMLGRDALRFSRRKKFIFWHLYQKQALEMVSCFRATAESEAEDIRALGLRQPIAIIPNGVDLPKLEAAETRFEDCPTASPFVLSLGRVHPKKGLDRLISAWAMVVAEFPNWKLRIVGPNEGNHADELNRQIISAGLTRSVSLEAPIFGEEKTKLMREAQVFALPTLHENFAMTVAESLAVGTPVISTKGAPWSGLAEHKCGFWIEHGADAMAGALRSAMSMTNAERRIMGERGREWMLRDFSWEGVAERMETCLNWFVRQGHRPDWILL